MTFSLADDSNSGYEDLLGVAFHVAQSAAPANLAVVQVTKNSLTSKAASGQFLSTEPAWAKVRANGISDEARLCDPDCDDPGFTIEGTKGGPGTVNEPYDVGKNQ